MEPPTTNQVDDKQANRRVLQGTRLFVYLAIAGALVFCGAGLTFRIASGGSLLHCLYAETECSTAAGTWFLGAITSFAFLAAYEAAAKAGDALRIAQQTYDLETKPRLGLAMCWETKHSRTRKIFVYDGKVRDNVPAGCFAYFQLVGLFGRSVLTYQWRNADGDIRRGDCSAVFDRQSADYR